VNAQPKIPSTAKLGKTLKSKVMANDTVKKASKILISPSKMKLNNGLKFKENPKGLINKIIKPIRFKNNRENRQRTLMYDFMMGLISKGQLKMDSVTVDEIMFQLDTINSVIKLNNKGIKATNHLVDSLVKANGINEKASRSVVDNIKTRMRAVLQASSINNKLTRRDLSAQITGNLKEIRKVQYSSAELTPLDSVKENNSYSYFKKFLSPKIKVIGWHDVQQKNEYLKYNYNYLSAINLTSYELSVSGKCKNPRDMDEFRKPGGVIEMAHQNNCDVHLTIFNNNAVEIQDFLRNSNARKTLLTEIDTLISKNKLRGINIYFNNVMKPEPLVKFITELHKNLKGINPAILLNMTIPAIVNNENNNKIASYNFEELNPLVDYYMVLTDGLIPQKVDSAQSASPLFAGERFRNRSIESTFSWYSNNIIPSEKFIMTVSYTGTVWEIDNFTGRTITNQIDTLKYADVLDYYLNKRTEEQSIAEGFDPDQASAFSNFFSPDSSNLEQIWYENPQGLYTKYNWALESGLGGVAIRGLGNDDGYSDLWDILGATLIKIDTFKIQPAQTEPGRFRKFWNIMVNAVQHFKWKTFKQDLRWAQAVRLKYSVEGSKDAYKRFDNEFNPAVGSVTDTIKTYINKKSIWDEASPYIPEKSKNGECYLKNKSYCYSLYTRWTIYATFFYWCGLLFLILGLIFSFVSFYLKRYILGSDRTRSIISNLPSVLFFMFVLLGGLWFYLDPSIKWIGAGNEEGANSLIMIYILVFGIVFGWFCSYNYHKYKQS
jgi:spore germination protein YaaH